MRYIVKTVVCDYGVFEKTDNEEQLKVICNSLSNAKLIADILNTDLRDTKYDVIERSKIDKAIEEIKQLPRYIARFPDWTEIHVSLTDVLKVLESIGE